MKEVLNLANIMVIEDDPFSQEMMAGLLKSIGVREIIVADNGMAAVEILSRRVEEVDLFICDVAMPEMDGYEFIRRVRYGTIPRFKDVPAIILTAKDSEKNLQSARLLKIDGFFVKPPSKAVLEKSIFRILKAQSKFALAAKSDEQT